MAIQFVDKADVKAIMEKTDTTHDAIITSLIQRVSKSMETYCNRSFKKESRTEVFNAGKKYYFISALPVDTSVALTVTLTGITQTVNSHYYLWEDIGLIEFITSPTDTTPKAVSITYTGGYTETDSVLAVPDDLKHACIEQVIFLFRRRKDIGLSSVSMPDGSINVLSPNDWLKSVLGVLNHYRLSAKQK